MGLTDIIQSHFVNATAQLAAFTPIYALFETTLGNYPDKASLSARGLTAVTLFAGGGYLVARARERFSAWSSKHRLTKNMSAGTRDSMLYGGAHFPTGYALYYGGYLIVNPLLNLFGLPALGDHEKRNFLDITYTVVASFPVSVFAGYIAGQAMDTYQHLAGMHESKRMPKRIKEFVKDKANRLVFAASTLAMATGVTIAAYKYIPESWKFDFISYVKTIITGAP
ncbi:MAG: hypothetical protein V1725_04475 [archaeon]